MKMNELSEIMQISLSKKGRSEVLTELVKKLESTPKNSQYAVMLKKLIQDLVDEDKLKNDIL
jgi:hypothetical protein